MSRPTDNFSNRTIDKVKILFMFVISIRRISGKNNVCPERHICIFFLNLLLVKTTL